MEADRIKMQSKRRVETKEFGENREDEKKGRGGITYDQDQSSFIKEQQRAFAATSPSTREA